MAPRHLTGWTPCCEVAAAREKRLGRSKGNPQGGAEMNLACTWKTPSQSELDSPLLSTNQIALPSPSNSLPIRTKFPYPIHQSGLWTKNNLMKSPMDSHTSGSLVVGKSLRGKLGIQVFIVMLLLFAGRRGDGRAKSPGSFLP